MSGLSEETKAGVARKIADAHRRVDPEITKIYRFVTPDCEDDPREPIKLLEINMGSTTSGIMPIGLPAHEPSGILYPSVVVEIHPTEWSDVESGKLSLPEGWTLDSKEEL